jgi:hypothetical protein
LFDGFSHYLSLSSPSHCSLAQFPRSTSIQHFILHHFSRFIFYYYGTFQRLQGKAIITKSANVPTLVIVDHHIEASTPKLVLTPMRERKNPTSAGRIRPKMPEEAKRSHRRLVSDISLMFSRQDQATSTRSGEGSDSREGSFNAIHEQMDSSDENVQQDCNELSTVTSELPHPVVHGSSGKTDLSSWFLPIGRPLAAAPNLLLAQSGTTITENDAKNKKRGRSCWVYEHRSRRKVGCGLPSNLIDASSEDDDTVVDAAVTLAKHSTEHHEEPIDFSSGRALPPPPFELITNRKAGMIPYPMSFQLIARKS